MASRTSYVVSSDNENYAESSPDPLAVSFNESCVRARPAMTRAPKQQPLASSSPSKQNRRLNTAEFDLSSPTKQMLLSTPRTGGASPWRIKVTVQAQPGSDSENMDSPTVNHVTHTKTTKIPLKDADASSPVKRRGRPRKSETAGKRKGTPVKKRASSKARRSSAGDTSAADVETDATPKRRRGRPRKTAEPSANDDIWGQVRRLSVGPDSSAADVETDATPRRRRGRPRKSIPPSAEEEPTPVVEEPVPQATPVQDTPEPKPSARTAPETCAEHSTTQEPRIPLKSTPLQTDLSRKLKARKNTPMASENVVIDISSGEDSDEQSHVHTPDWEEVSLSQHRQQGKIDDGNADDFEPLYEPAAETGAVDQEGNDETHFVFDEGATRMPDDTTIIDSENFSMISVDSLPSAGAFTSPVIGPVNNTRRTHNQRPIQNHDHLHIPSTGLHGMARPRSSPAPTHTIRTLLPPTSAPAVLSRYKTPSVEPNDLSNPPPIEPARLSPTEAQTPKIGRVVKAGAALQGLLDPNRVTPEAGFSKDGTGRQHQFDDLFRGFSERTRRELHDGLRLGQQLAEENESTKPSSPSPASPTKAVSTGGPAEHTDTAAPTPQQNRLLTPEDQDGDNPPALAPVTVQYPTLHNSDQASQLLSPVSSPENENEMHWTADVPTEQPVTGESQASNDLDASHDLANPEESPDIWEEEASRSSIVSERTKSRPTDNTTQIQDCTAQDSLIKPSLKNLPKTWRQTSPGNFQYDDEAEGSQMVTPPSTDSIETAVEKSDRSKDKMISKENQEDGHDSQGSEDSGMFFQANMPHLFQQKQPEEQKRPGYPRRRQQAEKLDLSLLLEQSLLPESSPPPASKSPAMDKRNPFLDTPPKLAALLSSPTKGSPLRQELRSSDISSESIQQSFEESTLPLAPSSPFHTFVEGETARSLASDQRQLMQEMGARDSSLRRIREEADEYLDAYEPQERTLNDVTEVTEPSRTFTMVASSPPKRISSHVPLLGNRSFSKDSSFVSPSEPEIGKVDKAAKTVAPGEDNIDDTQSSPNQSLDASSSEMLTTSPPPAHPAIKSLDQLPRVEPWTKTHYKALDKLYQLYKKQPAIFSPSPASPHSALNCTLLTNFLNATTCNFIGARYRAWGYNVIFTDSLLILCAAYMQLLTLDNIDEYEARAGKQIQLGDCGPGAFGEGIGADKVVERLATVILGEAVRRDEKKGKKVDKSGRLWVEWPE